MNCFPSFSKVFTDF